MWQDYVMCLVGVMFAVSMIPTIVVSLRAKTVHMPWVTLIVTVTGLSGIILCMASLGLVWSTVTNGCNCLSWITLGVIKKVKP